MAMTIEEMVQPAKDWTGESWGARLDRCASMLLMHGYITARERERIGRKIDKLYVDGLAAGRIVERPQP